MLLIDPNVVPIVGIVAFLGALSISARYVMRPVIDAFMRAREMKLSAGAADPARLDAQDRRIAEVEGELAAVKQELERLSAVEKFYAQLEAGRPSGAGDPTPAGLRPAPPSGGQLPAGDSPR